MSDAHFDTLIAGITTQGELSEADLLTLRRATGKDFKISAQEAVALFNINDKFKTPEAWPEFFINAITTFLVEQTVPHGYLTDAKASWLIARISKDGAVCTQTEIGILMSVLKLANNVTERLEKFALEQVKGAVVNGDGYWGKNRTLKPGVIGEAEVDLLRRVLYSVSSEGGASISRMEAETLFDINEQCMSVDNHESWQCFFVSAIVNHLMALAAWEEPVAAEALRREKWLEDTSPTGMFSLSNIVKSYKAAFDNKSEAPVPTHMQSRALANAGRVTASESEWLIKRLNRDGGIDSNERALLSFLADECPDIHASLSPLLNAA